MDSPAVPPSPAGTARPRTPEELAAWAAGLALDPEALDEPVHDAFARQAAEVNNDGLESQVRFLAAAYGTDRARALIDDCLPAPASRRLRRAATSPGKPRTATSPGMRRGWRRLPPPSRNVLASAPAKVVFCKYRKCGRRP